MNDSRSELSELISQRKASHKDICFVELIFEKSLRKQEIEVPRRDIKSFRATVIDRLQSPLVQLGALGSGPARHIHDLHSHDW